MCSKRPSHTPYRRRVLCGVVVLLGTIPLPAGASDETPPAAVRTLTVGMSGSDILLDHLIVSWTPVELDLKGDPESVDHYNVYGMTTPVSEAPWPLVGQTIATSMAWLSFAGPEKYFLVTAVDTAGNEGPPWQLPAPLEPVPTEEFPLSVLLNEGEGEVSWTPPLLANPDTYIVYWGTGAANFYDFTEVVGGQTSTRAYPLEPGTYYFFQARAFEQDSFVAQSTVAAGELAPGISCLVDSDCNDEIACTEDMCVDQWCYNVPDDAAASDGLFCTGVEICDPFQAGSVAYGTPPCASGTCNEFFDLCNSVPTDSAVFDSYFIPDSLRNSSAGTIWFNVTNIGSTTWTPETHALGAVGNSDPFSAEVRLPLAEGLTVSSGQSYTFRADTIAPSGAGTYTSQWQMVRLDPGGATATRSKASGKAMAGTPPLALSLSGGLSSEEAEDWFAREDDVAVLRSTSDPRVRELPRTPPDLLRQFRSRGSADRGDRAHVQTFVDVGRSGKVGEPGASSTGDVFFGAVAGKSVEVVNCDGLAELQVWLPDPMEIPKGIWYIYLGGENMLGGTVGGTNPGIPTLGVAADESDPSRPLPGISIHDQYSSGGYETWKVIFDASAPGVVGDYELTVSEGSSDVCHFKLPVRVLPNGPHVDMFTPAVPRQRYDGVVPRGSRYVLSISGKGLLDADVFPSVEGVEQVLIYDTQADRDAQISAQLVVLPTATPGTEFDLVVRDPSGQETLLPMLIGEGVWEPEGDTGGGEQGSAAKTRSPSHPTDDFVRVLSIPQDGYQGKLSSMPLEERRINLKVQEVHMPPGSEGRTPPELPPIYFQDVVVVDPESLRSSLSEGAKNGEFGDDDGIQWGSIGGRIDFSIGFSFLFRWLIHADARLFSLAFDVETGEFAPFIQGPPGTSRLLGGISIVVVWAADLTLYGGCTYSTIFGWSCNASLCWSVVSAFDAIGQGYHIARKGCWFNEEWGGPSDSGQSHTFSSPGSCSTVTPCVTDANGVCVTEVDVTACCQESIDLSTEGLLLHSGGNPVIIPFQWTNGYFPNPEPVTWSYDVARVQGTTTEDGSCCGDLIVNQQFETCDPPQSTVSLPGGLTAICNGACGYCTDGVLQSVWEQCDDGNTNSADACPNTCFLPDLNYDEVWIEWKSVLRPDLVKKPWGVFWEHTYLAGNNVPLGTLVNRLTDAKLRQFGWFSVDPEENILLGVDGKYVDGSKAYNDADDTGNRFCSDLFRWTGQNEYGPVCHEPNDFSGGSSAEIELERLSESHVRIKFNATAGPGCTNGPAPKIDYCPVIELRQEVQANGTLGPVQYKLTGHHDGFPWHNLLIGTDPDNLINAYEWDVCANGATPFSLTGDCYGQEVDIDPDWFDVPGTPAGGTP